MLSLKFLFKTTYCSLNKIEISQKDLIANYRYLSSLNPKIKVTPVLKSNAYGHGIKLVAQILEPLNPPFFCVDSIYEGYLLLRQGIKTPILIMGYVHPESLNTKRLPFSFAVYTKEQLLGIKKYQPQAGIHIFVDTGMHREGVALEELPEFLKKITSLSLNVEGLMSHLAMSDKTNHPFTKLQVRRFEKSQKTVKDIGLYPKWIHLANSSGLVNFKNLKGNLGNMARVGLALYGIDPQGCDKNLKPVLRFLTTLEQIKKIKKGEKIGYDFTFTAQKDMVIGVLPIGYNDGLDRRLSNRGYVSINNIDCRIIGRVSMNITVIDLTGVKNPKVGSTVVVYANDTKDKNSISSAARLCREIPYDLLVHLSPETKRMLV